MDLLNIRQYVVLLFSAFILASISLVGISGGVFNVTIGQLTIEQSSGALKTQIIEETTETEKQISSIIQSRFSTAEAFVNSLAKLTGELMDETAINTSRISYFDGLFRIENVSLLPNDARPNATYNGIISTTHSSWFVASSSGNQNQLPAITQSEINRTANLDFFFQTTFLSHPEFGWIYVTFSNTGLMRLYPGTIIDEEPTRNYEPRQDKWFTDAVASPNTAVYSSRPYSDTEGGLGVLFSITRAIKGNSGQVIGVAGIDLTLAAIQNTILQINILDHSGYSALVTKEGIIVAHPDSNLNSVDEVLSDREPELNAAFVNEILTATSSKVLTFKKATEEYILIVEPLIRPELRLLIFIPVSKVLAPVTAVQERLTMSTAGILVLIALSTVIVLVVSLFIGNIIAQTVVTPVAKFTNLMKRFSTQNARNEIFSGLDTVIGEIQSDSNSGDEVTQMTGAFKNMLQSVKQKTGEQMEAEKNFKPDW